MTVDLKCKVKIPMEKKRKNHKPVIPQGSK